MCHWTVLQVLLSLMQDVSFEQLYHKKSCMLLCTCCFSMLLLLQPCAMKRADRAHACLHVLHAVGFCLCYKVLLGLLQNASIQGASNEVEHQMLPFRRPVWKD